MFNIGEKLRNARQSQNLSLRDLAAKAEVSASLLSQIENGKANPSVMSLYNIAAALNLPIDYFFPDDGLDLSKTAASVEDHSQKQPAAHFQPAQVYNPAVEAGMRFEGQPDKFHGPLVRKEQRAKIELMGGVTWTRLTPGPEEDIEFLEIFYDIGGSSGPAMSRHRGREFGLVLEGELTLELGFECYVLQPGDSIIFDSRTPHRLINCGQVPMRALWVVFDS